MSESSGSQAPGTEAKNEAAGTTRVAFRFHTRALAALGRDLVTSDVVAVMEPVKNAYDAMATRVEVRIRSGDEDSNGPYIEIADDGHGMDHDTIVNVWCIDLRHLALVGLAQDHGAAQSGGVEGEARADLAKRSEESVFGAPARRPKRGGLWLNDGSGIRLRPQQPNHVWAYDFVAGSRAKVQDHPHVKYGDQVSVFKTFQM